MSRISFRGATDLLFENLTYSVTQLAGVLGIHSSSIVRARRKDFYAGKPPAEWETKVARTAREHTEMLRAQAARLEELAARLDAEAKEE